MLPIPVRSVHDAAIYAVLPMTELRRSRFQALAPVRRRSASALPTSAPQVDPLGREITLGSPMKEPSIPAHWGSAPNLEAKIGCSASSRPVAPMGLRAENFAN